MALLPPFQMPGGKRWQRDRIVKRIPEHEVYVEPFVGAGSVFLAKTPAELEVINDKDGEIAFFWRYVRDHAEPPIDALDPPSRTQFDKLVRQRPKADKDRFVRFLKVQQFSWRGNRTTYLPSKAELVEDGSAPGSRVLSQWPRYHERLQGVRVYNQNWQTVVRNWDGADTFFYLDPPYERSDDESATNAPGGTWFGKIDLSELARVLYGLKGRWLLSIDDEPEIRGMFDGARIEAYQTNKLTRRGGMTSDA